MGRRCFFGGFERNFSKHRRIFRQSSPYGQQILTNKTMDCRQATSCVYGPSGQLVFGGKNEDSQIFHVELPLDRSGRLEASLRLERLSERRPSRYRECYLNLRMIRNITSFLELPKPGILDLRCIVPGEGQHPIDALQNHLSDNASEENRLYVLPPFDFSDPARGCDLSLSIEEKLSSEEKNPGGSPHHRKPCDVGLLRRRGWNMDPARRPQEMGRIACRPGGMLPRVFRYQSNPIEKVTGQHRFPIVAPKTKGGIRV